MKYVSVNMRRWFRSALILVGIVLVVSNAAYAELSRDFELTGVILEQAHESLANGAGGAEHGDGEPSVTAWVGHVIR